MLARFKLPRIKNEPMVPNLIQLDYAPGSLERLKLKEALDQFSFLEIPTVIGGQSVGLKLASYHMATPELVRAAIDNSIKAKAGWESLPFADRCSVFLKAADLLSNKYKYQVMAATMLGQAKNIWQAEIDASAELADFWRFNCTFAEEIYSHQPIHNSPTIWNRVEYRPLEGFVLALSPFNFTAIGGNLPSAPALMGNVVLWKPSDSAIYSNYLVFNILREAGLPDGVIQFLPGNPQMIVDETFSHSDFAGLHFTGSTQVFKQLWKKSSDNLDVYKSYPRIVGETGGKNMHFIHSSANITNAALQTVRSAFEYSGQKCSACSRAYVPDDIYDEFMQVIVSETAKIKMGNVTNFENHMSAVINKPAFDRITSYIHNVKNGQVPSTTIVSGGNSSDAVGYYIEPTILLTTDPKSPTMVDELFGPVLTIYKYPADEFEKTLKLADETSSYALTCGIFSNDRQALSTSLKVLQNAAGNVYINDKSTGAVVGQQPFGGGRMSGTNDKAGFSNNLLRWVSPRTIKELFVPIEKFDYPSNR